MSPPDELAGMLEAAQGSRASLEQALAARAEGDPRLKMVLEMLAKSRRARVEDADGPTDQDELEARNEALAAALGACAPCWGGVEDCPECDGRGAPGWRVPRPKLFRSLVMPAVRRVRAEGRASNPQRDERRGQPK